jgi:hypothetical protein
MTFARAFQESFKSALVTGGITLSVWVVVFGCFLVRRIYNDHRWAIARIATLENAPKPTCPTCPNCLPQKTCPALTAKPINPEPLHITMRYYTLENKVTLDDKKQGKVVLVEGLTNREISPVDVTLTCTQDITPMNDALLGISGAYFNLGLEIVNAHSVRATIGSPSWTSQEPLGIPVFVSGNDPLGCQFVLNENSKVKQ